MHPIPDGDLEFRFIRSAGPGGQNVNKVATAVQLRFDLAGTRALSEAVKARLRMLAGHRLNDDGSVLIVSRRHRTQEQNRRDALEKLDDLIQRAHEVPKPRKATRPTRASKERHLQTKRVRQKVKRNRGRAGWDD